MLEKQLIHSLLKKWKRGGFSIVYWDGEKEEFGEEISSFEIIFHRQPHLSLRSKDPSLILGEAYMQGDLDIKGSMDDVLRTLALNTRPERKKSKPNFSSIKSEKNNIHQHYDLGNDFFSLWLDSTLSYSCAYFKTPEDSLEKAQLQKIDRILQKLQLKKGEHLLDIGSGWGWLIIKAAQQYGVEATGITLSEEQYLGTRERIKELGLEGQVHVRLQHYQELEAEKQTYDKISSIGMIEHVGRHNLNAYMAKINELLKPQGLFLLHSITGMTEEEGNAWIKKYIFPGGCIPSLRELCYYTAEYDFHILHLESLRLHYALTLEHWYNNFIKQQEKIKEKYGEKFVRMWSLYLSGCAASFRTSGLDIHQILCSKDINNRLPLVFNF